MRSVVIVVVLPLAKLVVEEVDVVADAVFVEQLIELLVVDAMRAFDDVTMLLLRMTEIESNDTTRYSARR